MTHSFPTRLSSDLTGVGASEVLAGVGGNGMEAKVMQGNGCQVVSITHDVPAHPVLYTSERRAATEPGGAVGRWPRVANDHVPITGVSSNRKNVVSGQRGSVRVDLGGGRSCQKNI